MLQFERFLPPDAPAVASVYAPIMFPPAGVLMFKRTTDGEYTGCSCCCLRHLQGVSEKVAPPPKTFCNIFTSAKSFCVKLCKFAIRHAMMKNYIISEMLHCTGTLHFHFLGEYSELDRVKTMGTRGKMNAI